MKFRALTLDGDWTWGKGVENYLTGSDAIAADIKTRLLSFAGDCFFAEQDGIDWFSLLGTNNEAALVFSIRSIIINTEGVSNVTQVSVNRDEQRRIAISYSATTVFGTEVREDVFSAPASEFTGISKFVANLIFAGDSSQDVNVSAQIVDARTAVWILYDADDSFTPVLGAVQPLNATTVRVTMLPPRSGNFRLVGIA